MRRQLLFLLVSVLSVASDPCNNCPLPKGFNETDGPLCQNPQSDDSYSKTLIRYSLGNECYLQMTDCPAYDIMSGSQCVGFLPPQKALRCVDGKFRTPARTMGHPIDRIRCNPDAFITPLPRYPTHDDCELPNIDKSEIACGEVNPNHTMGYAKAGNLTHNQLLLAGCEVYNMLVGYDGVGSCRQVEDIGIQAHCENGQYKLEDGRFIYKARCGLKTAVENNTDTGENNTGECVRHEWKYNWITDTYFKVIAENTTRDQAAAACIAEGGLLASILNQEDNDFVAMLGLMSHEAASTAGGINIWIAAESNNATWFKNYDNNLFMYDNFDPALEESQNGTCVYMTTGTDIEGQQGQWKEADCSQVTQAFACRKSKATTCENITQLFVHDPSGSDGWIDGDLTFDYYVEEDTGYLAADFICTSPIPNKEVHISSGDHVIWYNKQCTVYRRVGIYICHHDGKWVRNGRAYVPPLGICEVDLNSTCTP